MSKAGRDPQGSVVQQGRVFLCVRYSAIASATTSPLAVVGGGGCSDYHQVFQAVSIAHLTAGWLDVQANNTLRLQSRAMAGADGDADADCRLLAEPGAVLTRNLGGFIVWQPMQSVTATGWPSGRQEALE